MVIVKILVILFLGALVALGLQVVFSKNDETKIGGGGGVTASDSKSEKQKNHENN